MDGTNRYVIVDHNSNEGYIAFRNDQIFVMWGSGISSVALVQPIDIDQWYNVTFVHEMNDAESQYKMRLHVNGDYVGEASRAIPPSSIWYGPDNYLRIGRYWRGLIDEVRIYERALTAQEIQTIYAQTKGKYLANE